VANIMESGGYVRIKVDSNGHGPIAGWSEGPEDAADMVYFVNYTSMCTARRPFRLQPKAMGSWQG
jgi:hypothetical protein